MKLGNYEDEEETQDGERTRCLRELMMQGRAVTSADRPELWHWERQDPGFFRCAWCQWI
jgi:hypothetical protein